MFWLAKKFNERCVLHSTILICRLIKLLCESIGTSAKVLICFKISSNLISHGGFLKVLKNISQLICCVIIVNQFGFSNNAIGAEATLSKDVWDAPIVDIIGPIEKGDLKKKSRGHHQS
jgi:hypothetical protein